MRRSLLIVFALFVAGAGSPLFAQNDPVDSNESSPKSEQAEPGEKAEPAVKIPPMRDFLPKKDVDADVVQARASEEATKITKKFREAIAAKADWWKTYLAENAGKRPLPYHANFGITEEEYKSLLNAGASMRLVKVGRVRLGIKRTDNSLEMTIPGADKAVNPIVFDFTAGGLLTPAMNIDEHTSRDSGPQGGLLGHHQSHNWKKTVGDPASGTYQSVALTLGRVSKTGTTFMQYNVVKVKEGKPELRFQVMLFMIEK